MGLTTVEVIYYIVGMLMARKTNFLLYEELEILLEKGKESSLYEFKLRHCIYPAVPMRIIHIYVCMFNGTISSL